MMINKDIYHLCTFPNYENYLWNILIRVTSFIKLKLRRDEGLKIKIKQARSNEHRTISFIYAASTILRTLIRLVIHKLPEFSRFLSRFWFVNSVVECSLVNKGGRGCWNARVPGGERKERRGEKVEEEGGDGRRNDTARSWKVEKRGRKGEPKRKQERKVDGTTSLALMRAIQLPQCSSNTIPPSSTSNQSSSTGAGVVERVFEPVRIFKRKLLMCVRMEKNGTREEKNGWYRRKLVSSGCVFVCSTVKGVEWSGDRISKMGEGEDFFQ